MIASADLGVSMIVAPAYVISLKIEWLTFGMSEIFVQAILFIVFCIAVKKVKLVYFSSFLTCILYSVALDCWRTIIPLFNPEMVIPGSMYMPLRILLFTLGMLLTTFSIAMFYKTYLYPQVYDFFTKGLCARYKFNMVKVKTIYDFSSLTLAVVLTLFLFAGEFRGVGIGTVVMTVLNGVLIGTFLKFLEKFTDIQPIFKQFAQLFDLS